MLKGDGASGSLLDRVLDKTILFSFDRSGFERHARRFADPGLEIDLAGRTFAVTGANSGLGLATARGLAARGGTVWMLCRSRRRGEEALTAVRAETGNPEVHLEPCDLADPSSVHAAASRLANHPLDALIHNAGLLPSERVDTAEGLELTFAVHVVAPLLLTSLLLPRLLASDDARVIFVSSGGMYGARLDVDRMVDPPAPYDGVKAYAHTKRAQVVLAEQLSECLARRGVAVNSMHPGWAATPGVAKSLPGFQKLLGSRLRTPEQGADTILWLAASRDAGFANGRFFFDRRPAPIHLGGWNREPDDERGKLWSTACRLAGLEQTWCRG